MWRHGPAIVISLVAFALSAGTAAGQSTEFQIGVDLQGTTYGNFDLPRPRPKLCQDACINDSRCDAWTFLDVGITGPRGSCWLKSGAMTPQPNACCVSGFKK